jgi:hypothetical protein
MESDLISARSAHRRGNSHETGYITRNQRSDYSWKVRDGSHELHDSRANCFQGGVAMSASRRQDTLGPFAVRSPSPVDPAQILTLAELAERLKVSERWVYEKSRRRCLNPLPCIRIGRICDLIGRACLRGSVSRSAEHERSYSRIDGRPTRRRAQTVVGFRRLGSSHRARTALCLARKIF